MIVPIITPDVEIDIEYELSNEEFGHALSYCSEHLDQKPVSGTILQALCGRLFRVNWNLNTNKCPECAELFNDPTAGYCWVCKRKSK